MMGAGSNNRKCGHPGPCHNRTNRWRSCPVKDCREEQAFCDEHGGDAEAVLYMELHIADHRKEQEK